MKRQKGMSLIGLLLTGICFASVFLLGMKVVPAISEYYAVKKVINAIADSVDGSTVTASTIRKEFNLRSSIDDIRTVNGADLDVIKRGGKVEISVEYSRRVPVVANVSLVFDFEASTADN